MKQKILVFSLVLISIFFAWINIPSDKDFIGNDSGLTYYSNHWQDYYFTWNTLRFGRYSAIDYASLYQNFIFQGIKFVRLPIATTVYFIFLAVILLGSYFTVYYYLLIKGVGKDRATFSGFISSFLGLFQTVMLTIINYPVINFQMTFASYFAFTAIILKIIYEKRLGFGNFLTAILISFMVFGGNPANTLVYGFTLFFVLLSLINYLTKRNLIQLFLLGVATVFLQSYQLIFFFYRPNPYQLGNVTLPELIAASIQSLKFNSLRSDIINLLQLDPAPTFNQNQNFSYFSGLYYAIVGFIPVILTLPTFLAAKMKNHTVTLIVCLVILLFFAKGYNEPFLGVNMFFYNNFPPFGAFRSVVYKFFIPLTLPLLILVGVTISMFKQKVVVIFSIALLAYYLPFFYIFSTGNVISSEYLSKIPVEYYNLVKRMETEKLEENLISPLPASSTLTNWFHGSSIYSYFTSKFVFDNSNINNYFRYEFPVYNQQLVQYRKSNLKIVDPVFLSLFNTRTVIVQKDVVNQYDFGSGGGLYNYNGFANAKFFENNLPALGYKKIENNSYFSLYRFSENFLPRIYIPPTREAPMVEFKKVDPTKYRVKIHNIQNNFSLVFSQSFDKDWKVYREDSQVSPALDSSNYKIIPGNEADQASHEELTDYINKGWVSDVGKNDFVSKNYQGTIQNDNLPNGKIWDTWFKTPLPENSHQLVNGYANSWIIDPANICPKTPCDIDLIVEFWPQRLSYLGFIISGLTLVASLIIILVARLKK